MFQEPQSFSQKIEVSGKLMQMLNGPALTPEQLFAVPNIQGDIITKMQNLPYFFSYCKQRKEFTKTLFKICFDSSYEDFENDDKKNVAQYMMKIFTHDQMTLNNFMFGEPETNKETAQKQEDQQILEKQERQKKQQLNIQPKQQVAQKYQLVILSLQHLQRDNKNETCLGYINQLYASILNKAGNLFIQFLEQHPKYAQLLIGNMQYTSIGKMVAKILSCKRQKQQKRCQKFKKFLFERKIVENWKKNEQQQSNTNVNVQQVKQEKEEKQKRTDLIYPQQYEYNCYAQTYPIQENYQYATQQKQQEKQQEVQDNNQGQTQTEGQSNVANQVQIQSESAGSLNNNEAEQGTSHKVNDHK